MILSFLNETEFFESLNIYQVVKSFNWSVLKQLFTMIIFMNNNIVHGHIM